MELDIRLYQEETETILLDIYTPKLECIPRRETQMLEQLVVRNAAKCRVSDRISVEVRILYSISDDEMPFYSMETVIPFSQMIEGEQVNGQYGYQLQADLEQLSMMMLDSSEIEVKVVLNLNALLVMQWEEDLIQEIQTREPDQKKLEELPGIVCYVVQPRDTLWDIAKMFYTTMEAIRKLNDLGEGEVKPRQTLLVVKNSVFPLPEPF